jgi:phosphoribosylformylglycinamidine synthase subunit PurQ / glutaminase
MNPNLRFGVVVFPGSNCDDDLVHVLSEVVGVRTEKIWHKSHHLPSVDAVFLPGGFSYGDYLRSGAIARYANIMPEVSRFAHQGGLVWGICNGFQILCEAGLLPGVLLPNRDQQFICENVLLKVCTSDSIISNQLQKGQILKIPIAHADGRYHADESTLHQLKSNHQILFKYCNAQGELSAESNLNGSMGSIAGICNAQRNVFGMMPHPERASESILGNTDGLGLFQSMMHHFSQVAIA